MENGSNRYQWVTSPSYGFSFWSPFIATYLYFKNSGLFICPSQPKPTASAFSFRIATWNMDGYNHQYESSYGVNTDVSTVNGDPWAPEPLSLALLQSTATFVLIKEEKDEKQYFVFAEL